MRPRLSKTRLLFRGRQAAEVGDDLPALLFGKTAPGGHAFVGIAVLEHPGEVTVGCVADSLAAQAGAVAEAGCVGTVAFGAVLIEEDFACFCGPGLSGDGIGAGVVFIGDATQPFAVGLGHE